MQYDRIVTRFCLASPWRKLAVVILAGLVLGSFGYSVSAYPQLRSWIVSRPVPDGDVNQVSVKWTLAQCDLKTGVFRIFVQPGTYHVSFTGYPLTLPPNGEIGGTNLPLTVNVEPHRLTQVEIGINFGI